MDLLRQRKNGVIFRVNGVKKGKEKSQKKNLKKDLTRVFEKIGLFSLLMLLCARISRLDLQITSLSFITRNTNFKKPMWYNSLR